jgi:hypothetical protein
LTGAFICIDCDLWRGGRANEGWEGSGTALSVGDTGGTYMLAVT